MCSNCCKIQSSFCPMEPHQAQYALESSSQPLGISEYELEKFYPEKLEGTIPTIKEIEEKLKDFAG